MCGIAGIVGLGPHAPPPAREELVAMAAALRHRGPDEFGVYRDARAGLAHARLSIIDLATGQQPLCNEDGSLWISFNGEIFNYLELRHELTSLGHVFRTHSDTEVIVHAFEAWGDEAFARFNGQFAVALWDATRCELILARDRLGIRPLHLCEHAGRLYFASEVKALFAADRSIPREFDPIGLAQTFTFWTVVAPRTVFRGVSELEPGHVRRYRDGAVEDRAFWRPSFPADFRGTIEDAATAVRDALDRATELRIVRADVPVGSYLSGGLDSSIIAALGVHKKGDRLRTFSMRFADAEYDETEYQRQVVALLGSEHSEVIVTRADIAAVFPEVVAHAERPLLRTAPAPLHLLSKLVRESGIKVVLTGEGADEMFAGYDLFREAKVRRFWARRPGSRLRPRLLERLYPYLARSPVAQKAMARQFFGQRLDEARLPGFSHDLRWRGAAALQRLFSPELRDSLRGHDPRAELLATLPDEFSRWSLLAQDQYLEIRTLLSGYLLSSQGDRMLMSHSVEGRFPFLDRDVVDLAASLPDGYKLRALDEKHVLKRVARGLIPESVARRKKQPYRAPDALSFTGDGAPPWIAERLSETALRETGVFQPDAVQRLWRKCRARDGAEALSNADNMALVGVLSTQLLQSQLIDAQPHAAPITLRTLVERGIPMSDAVPLLHDYLIGSAARLPDKIALVAQGQRLSYAELDARSNALANTLVARGVARGDRVVLFLDNTAEAVVAFWAVLKANAVVSAINPLTKTDKLAWLLADCRATAFISDSHIARVFQPAVQRSPHLKTVIVSGQPGEGWLSWSDALAGDRQAPPPRRNLDVDLASIIYTSGSTGEPKGVMLTHRNMLTAATSISSYLRNVEDDVILGVLPLAFDYGLYQMIMAFRMGARLVLERSFTFPAQVLSLMAEERVTGFPGVPTIFATLAGMKSLDKWDLSSIRYVTNTAAALPVKHITMLRELFPQARIYSMYGLTECKRCTYLPPEDLGRKPESVGIAIPNTELWLVDENDQRLGPNQVGQLVIRGATVMKGYWEKPEATAKKLRPGPLPGEQVLYTGDYCRLDDEGYLYFVGRMDDIIKSRGEKVAPKEVENVLMNVPGVREAAVIGVPDELLGQAVKAFAVLDAGSTVSEADLVRECQKRLESFMVPKYMVLVPELPKTTTGKIKKTDLR